MTKLQYTNTINKELGIYYLKIYNFIILKYTMARISPKSRKLLIIGLFSIIAVFSIAFFVIKTFKVEAQDVETIPTSVIVGNSAPTFDSGPAEATASTATAPTAIGATITFNATATDTNGENYYFIVCSTNAVVKGTAGGAPTCAAGAKTYCEGTISAKASGSPATCTYKTVAGDTWENEWYGFVCDNNTSSECSMSQGSGGTGSPFYVNHPPTFTSVSNNAPVNPGASVTWTTQTTSDPDTGSTVKLLICKSNTAPTNGACSGGASGTWCSSSAVASNPTCSYSVPNPNSDGSNNAYAFVVDNFNLLASSTPKNSHFTVNNIAPVVSAVTFNSGNDINLAENTTTPITVKATVTDNNGCGKISNVYAYAYRSGKGYTNCDTLEEANNNFCYPQISCSVDAGTCSGASDAAANYTCTINFQYYADATASTSGTIQFPTENWLATVKAIDNNSTNHNLEVTSGIEMNALIAFDISPKAINYGTLSVGGKNDPLNQILTTTATGNVGLDQEHKGIPKMCTNYDASTNPNCATVSGTQIDVTKQKYGLTASTSYASGTQLTTSPVEVEINVPKVTTGTPTTKNIYWGIEIPNNTLPGLYKGMNTIYAKIGEVAEW